MFYLFKMSLNFVLIQRPALYIIRLDLMKRIRNSKARGAVMKVACLNRAGKTRNQESNNSRSKPLAPRPCGLECLEEKR